MGEVLALDGDWGNYTAQQCFGLPSFSDQVGCHAQHLNVSDPPRRAGRLWDGWWQ